MLKRHGGHDTMVIKPTNFNFKKSKDMWHLYTCVAIILYGPFIFYQNVFVGEATLIEIPEGYRPKHWEYYKVNIISIMNLVEALMKEKLNYYC